MGKLKKRNLSKLNKKSIISESGNEKIALAELVTIFDEEAYKICRNRQLAKLIALNALQEYVLKNTKNITIDL
ncbi:MAG: hypothetical protein ACYSTS_01010 [Planctomycetota bacterium]|jgi:hypothetical protein